MIIKDENKITHYEFVDYCNRYGLNATLAKTIFDFMEQVRDGVIRVCDSCNELEHEEHLRYVEEELEFCEDCIRDL